MPASSAARGSRSSLFNDDLSGEQELPAGSCNYRDLSIGTRAPLCGCQRFYLNGSQHAPDGLSERAWCFCGHHACFHNAFGQQQTAPELQAFTSPRMTAHEHVIEVNNATAMPVHQAGPSFTKAPTGLGIQAGLRSQSQSINTRVWQALNEFARNQEDGNASITTSKLPSTAAPSIAGDPRRSPGLVEQSQKAYRTMGPPVTIPQVLLPKANDDYSATEVATPSIAGTPDFRAISNTSREVRVSPRHRRADPSKPEPKHAKNGVGLPDSNITVNHAPSLHDLQNLVRTYSRRLEALESLSFSQVPFEEIQYRFDLFDGRILDLEQWRIEQDKQTSSPETGHQRLLRDDIRSFASDASYDRNAAIHTEAAVLATLAANAETHPRIDALEGRVTDLESAALPSYTHPWRVQVVLLPWSRELKGIWFSSHEATQHSLRSATQASEEWTTAQSATNLSFQSAVNGAWTTQSIEAWANDAQEWLSPKACGPNGTVFKRLASRGLIKDVTFDASDARNILHTISSAFDSSCFPGREVATETANKFQGLREPFVPLRKIRKSSRLRFLDPSEMTTSAIWTASFLDSCVFMKTGNGQRRLYVTTADAYIQPTRSPVLTWKHFRDRPGHVTEGEDEPLAQHSTSEDCWIYHENLDQPISAHSSFGASQWSTESQVTDTEARLKEPSLMSSPVDSRIMHQRTVSLPNSTTRSGQFREGMPQRRIASFGAATKHQQDAESGVDIIAKRRRISLSPEAERRGNYFTPRWSREPPSPFTSEAAAESRSQIAGSRKRGTTPFAYATPHSNSNYVARVEFVSGDGDTEVDTDVLCPSSHHGEEEWEGVEDRNMSDAGAEGGLEDSQDEASDGGGSMQ